MKKVFLTALCATMVVYGGEAPQTSHKSTVEELNVPRQKSTKKLKHKNNKIHKLKHRSYWIYGFCASVGSIIRCNRPLSLLCAGICGVNMHNPNYFSKNENILSLKTSAKTFLNALVKSVACQVEQFAKQDASKTATSTTLEKPQNE